MLEKKEFNMVYDKEATVEVTKEFTFDSCHQLIDYDGACARLHGHTYKLQVTLRGRLDEQGMILDFNRLKDVVNTNILRDLDHHNLNERLPFNTTAENMAVYFFDVLCGGIYGICRNRVQVYAVKLWETPTSCATFRGVRGMRG